MNERQMYQFIAASLSLDALNLRERPQFMADLKDALARERRDIKERALTEAEEERLQRACEKMHDRLEKLAGGQLAVFWGMD